MSTENLNAAGTNAAMEDPFAIFGTKVEDIVSYEEQEKRDWGKTFFEQDPEKGECTALIKLCLNVFDPKDSLPKRYTYKLPIPENPDRTWTFLSPSTVGQKCPVMEEWFALKAAEKKGDAVAGAKAKNLSRKRNRAMMIQIINDLQNPNLNGQFRILRFPEGMELDNLIAKKVNPSDDERKLGAKPVNVFDPFYSPLLILRCVKGQYGRDFSKSSWAETENNHGNMVPLELDSEGNVLKYKVLGKADAEDKEKAREYLTWIMNELKKPEISLKENWLYSEPDEKTLERVKQSLELIKTGTVTATADAPAGDGSAKLDKPVDAAAPTAAPAAEQKADAPVAAPAAATSAAPKVQAPSETSQDEAALMKELGLG